MDSTSNSSPLINLPREIRDMIYSSLIPEEIAVQLQDVRTFPPNRDGSFATLSIGTHIKYELLALDPLDVAVFKALLFVNKQIRAEWQHEVGKSPIGLFVDMRGRSGAGDDLVIVRQSSKMGQSALDTENFIGAFHHVKHLHIIGVDGRIMKNLDSPAQRRKFLAQSDTLLRLTDGSITANVGASTIEAEPKSYADKRWDAAMLADTKTRTARNVRSAVTCRNYPHGTLGSPTLVWNIYAQLHFGRNNTIDALAGFHFTRVLEASYARRRYHFLKDARERDESAQIDFDWSEWDQHMSTL